MPPAEDVVLRQAPRLRVNDYIFRPLALEDFSLYYFFSSCQVVKDLNNKSMDWIAVGETRQGSFASEPLRSKVFPELPLLDASHQPIFKYGYYIQLRTEKTWRVPTLHTKLPRVPDLEATPEEKGIYALFLMFVFRPHRDILQIARPYKAALASPHKISKEKREEAAWTAVYDEFQRW